MPSESESPLARRTATVTSAGAVTTRVRQLASACPRCGAGVPSEQSDFCEHCSAHLYPGHCVFCLGPFAPGQAYCRGCGLPPEGVTCGNCGTFSRFDFCPNPDCGAGLTPRAAAELARLEGDPEVVEAFADLDEIGVVLAAMATDEPTAWQAIAPAPVATDSRVERATIQQASPAPDASPPLAAAPFQTQSKGAPRPTLAAQRAAATGARSAEQKARVRALAEQAAQEAMLSVCNRPFPSAQEARSAGTALQVALRYRTVTERLETIAWRCNRFGCEHPEPGGMSLCSDPSGGGVPIMRVITQLDDRTTEFTA